MDVYARYSPFIQDFIYRNGWQNLRGVQNAAGEAIFCTDDNVLLCASTASGKTEAAFFPILTLMDENPPATVGVLYIAPLKALINDQYDRLSTICEEADITVTRWHGDAPETPKRNLLKKPSGILQITPESLEALMIRKHGEIPSLFYDLRFIIIDEIHSLLRGDRGMQTFCLIERLCKLAGCNPRRVGLSATIGNPELAGRFLSAGSDRNTAIPQFESKKDVWRLSLEHFYIDEVGEVGVQASPPATTEDGMQASPPATTNDGAQAARLPIERGGMPALQLQRAADPGLLYIFENT